MQLTENVRVSCDSCAMVSINGVACHESRCPNAGKSWIIGRGWVRFVECRECGAEVEAGESCDCDDDTWMFRDDREDFHSDDALTSVDLEREFPE